MTPPDLAARAGRVRLLLLDVDGVLTDGRIVYADDGTELKRFHVRDGSGLKFWRDTGKRAAVLSGRSSPAVDRRATELGLAPVVQGQGDKLPAFERVLADLGLAADEVCAVGDDLPDLPVLARAGLAVAVADACPEVRAAAHYVTTAPGGAGAVREAVEWLLKLTNEWGRVVGRYQT
ncbi:MAG TPA: HAD hydrolase family protein [Urbifossiella sp.]|jgi:3-deoxy-D-manno-octulosonate 8-phosphate phosphatase (KDO 8-P phosphatase)|nr:HAD hydrolase family protein [Urbifossiella sp.]